jgi:hypothetical protein
MHKETSGLSQTTSGIPQQSFSLSPKYYHHNFDFDEKKEFILVFSKDQNNAISQKQHLWHSQTDLTFFRLIELYVRFNATMPIFASSFISTSFCCKRCTTRIYLKEYVFAKYT